MAERTPAPGRVWTNRSTGNALAACEVDGCPGILWAPDRTLGSAGDMLRAHLRTEHADLWKRCGRCAGKGYDAWVHDSNRWTCTRCNGRGYVERSAQDSHAARQDASSTPDGSKGAGSENGAQIAGNACGHTLHDGGLGRCEKPAGHQGEHENDRARWTTGEP